MTWDKSFEIKKIYTEYPDVDVIELKDGTFIGINSETIVHYHGELFADDNVTINRPDRRKYLAVYCDGTQKQWMVNEINIVFEDKELATGILLLELGESLNWNDGISQALSVVRVK